MAANLFIDCWKCVDSSELMMLLEERIGGPGQFDGRADNPNVFYLPRARSSCEIKITFRDRRIVRLDAGPAFDGQKWQAIAGEIEFSLIGGAIAVGRGHGFAAFRVTGYWHGENSGVQILAPAGETPSATCEIAPHPFVLEFPFQAVEVPARDAGRWKITLLRRARHYRRIMRLLNVLLMGGTTFLPERSEHFWALLGEPFDPSGRKVELVQHYFVEVEPVVADRRSDCHGEPLEQIPPDGYYELSGYDGKGLRVPSDLDECICHYFNLSRANRDKFDRAAFWMDMARRQWPNATSSSYAALVSAVEALTSRGVVHRIYCDLCQRDSPHEVPSATARFRSFLETYAPGEGQKKRRDQMYQLRCAILHGSALMQFDEGIRFPWDLPYSEDQELHNELWRLARIALRNWLRNPAPAPSETSARRRQEPKEGEVARAAYYIWENSGREHGRDLAHWYAAEDQLREG